MSFVVMAPEHKLVESLKLKVESGDVQIKNWDKVQEYIEQAKHKTQLERTELQKEKHELFWMAFMLSIHLTEKRSLFILGIMFWQIIERE